MSSYQLVAEKAAQRIGLSLEQIRSFSPSELRSFLEKKNKKTMTFISEYPIIGRGNVLRDGLVNKKAINKDIDKILDKG